MTEYHLNQMQDYEDQTYQEDEMTDERFNVSAEKWQGKLDELPAEGGVYLYLPAGKTRVKLLLSPERTVTEFYQPVLRMFKDNSRTQFMMPVVVVDKEGIGEEVKYLTCPKTVLKGILKILADGEYDLLHPAKGHSITIDKTGSGFDTEYNVLPSKDPVVVDYNTLEFDKDLIEYATDLEALDRDEKKPAKEDNAEEIPW